MADDNVVRHVHEPQIVSEYIELSRTQKGYTWSVRAATIERVRELDAKLNYFYGDKASQLNDEPTVTLSKTTRGTTWEVKGTLEQVKTADDDLGKKYGPSTP